VVVEYDKIGAAELLAVRLSPLWFFAGIAGAVGVASGGDAPGPKVVGVFLAFRGGNDSALGDRFRHLIGAIDDLCVDALRVPDPAAPSVGPAHTKGRLVSFRVAHFLETQDAINIVIVVGRDDRAILAVAFAGAFLGTGPAAMV